MTNKTDPKHASIKVRAEFVHWLKVEAAMRKMFIGDLLELYVSQCMDNQKPWEKK